MGSRWFAWTTLALLLLVSAAHALAAVPMPPCKALGSDYRQRFEPRAVLRTDRVSCVSFNPRAPLRAR
jgi:hypothetical protein